MGARERLELERERELRDRDLNDRIKEEMLKQRSSFEAAAVAAPPPPPYAVGLPPHLLGAAGRYSSIPPTSIPSGFPPPSLYNPPSASTASLLAAERDRYERYGE